MEEKITEKTKKIILSLVFALAIFLITFHFTDTPRVWVDEGIFTNVAENLALHGKLGLQTEPGSFFRLGPILSTNYPVIFPVALSFKIFSTGLWQARLPMIIYMFLLVVFFYLFTKKRYGFYPAVGTVLLLISFAPFYGNGRPVQGEVPGLVFLILGSLFLLYLEKTYFENKKLAMFSGLFLGLAAATKPIYLLMLVVAVPLILFFWIKKIKNKKIILLLLIAFLIPIFLWFVINFPTKNLMLQIIPTITNLIGNNSASSLSSTTLSPTETIFVNLRRFFTESTPALFFFLLISVIFIFGRKYFKTKNWDFSISECLIFLAVMLNWFGYLLGTGWYRYFFPAHTLLYLFFPGAIMILTRSINRRFFGGIILVIPVILILFQFFHLIFLSDTSLVVSRTRNSNMSDALSVIPPTKKVLFYRTVDSIIFLKGDNYSQYLEMSGVFEAGNKNSLSDISNDFILADNSEQIINMVPFCYTKTIVGKYILFQKTDSCIK